MRSGVLRLLRRLAAQSQPGPASAEEAGRRESRRRRAARERERREARRAFLAGGGALGLAAGSGMLLSRSLAAVAAARPARVVIIGGGLAGLTAAWQLHRQGVDARLFEGAPRLGGRCLSERKAFDEGQIAERGGELIDTAHDEIIDLALQLGLTLDDLHHATPRGIEAAFMIDGRRYSEAEAVRDLAGVWPALARDARRLGEDLPTHARFTPAQQLLDRMSAKDWLQSRVPGGLSSPIARLLANAYVEELGGDLEEISAVTVVDLLRDSPRDRFSPYDESDQRYHVRGGNDLIVQRLAEPIQNAIETGTRLVALVRRPDSSYVLTLSRDQATTEVSADRVILALPFTLLREVDLARAGLSPRKLVAIRELGMGRNTKLQLQFRERPWLAAGGNGETRVEGSYQVSWEVTRAQAGAAGILNFYSGGTLAVRAGDRTPEEQARAALADVARVHPGIDSYWNGRVIRNPWDRNPWSRGSYSLLKPGQYTAFHGIESRAEGGLHFAGEQSSDDWYGFLNGAVESGLRAAREVRNAANVRKVA